MNHSALLVAISSLTLGACAGPAAEQTSGQPEVKWIGASSALQNGDLSSKTDLKNFSHLPHFYALGPVERMGGEITVFDSMPAVATIQDGKIHVSGSWDQKPPLLVYSQVAHWHEVKLPDQVRNLADVEAYVAEAAQDHGIDTSKPFAFRLHATPTRMQFHVFNMPADAQPGDKPLGSYKTHWEARNETIDFLGFYSRSHESVFIPKNATTHIHMKSADGAKAGHVDSLDLQPGGLLYLPE